MGFRHRSMTFNAPCDMMFMALGNSAMDMQNVIRPRRMRQSFDLNDGTNDITGLKGFHNDIWRGPTSLWNIEYCQRWTVWWELARLSLWHGVDCGGGSLCVRLSILRNVASTFQRYSNDLMSPRKEPFTIEPKVHWELCFIQSESSKPDYLHVCIKANDHYLQVESKREASQNNVRTEFHPRSAHAWSLITHKDTLHSEPIGSFMKVHMSLRCPQSRHQRSICHVFLSQEVWNAWGADSLRLKS